MVIIRDTKNCKIILLTLNSIIAKKARVIMIATLIFPPLRAINSDFPIKYIDQNPLYLIVIKYIYNSILFTITIIITRNIRSVSFIKYIIIINYFKITFYW